MIEYYIYDIYIKLNSLLVRHMYTFRAHYAALSRAQKLALQIGFFQVITAVVASIFLREQAKRTGWAQTFGFFAAVGCAIDPALSLALYYSEPLKVYQFVISLFHLAFTYAGLVSLVSNTEDDQHSGVIDDIETAAILLTSAWGAQCARFAAHLLHHLTYADQLAYQKGFVTGEHETCI